jgi:hypothetical protein
MVDSAYLAHAGLEDVAIRGIGEAHREGYPTENESDAPGDEVYASYGAYGTSATPAHAARDPHRGRFAFRVTA